MLLSLSLSSGVSTTTEASAVTADCTSTYSYFSMALLALMGLVGVLGNLVLFGCIVHKHDKVPSDVIFCALAVVDLTFNIAMTPFILWMNNYKAMMQQYEWTMLQIKYEAYVCCFYSFTTTTFFAVIGLTRYVKIRCPDKYRDHVVRRGLLFLLVAIIYIVIVLFISILYSGIYIGLTGVMMVITVLMYILIICRIQSFKGDDDGGNTTLNTAQRGATLSLFYATLISFMVLTPCITTMLIWCWPVYSDFFFGANAHSCTTFVLINFFHHPFMAINFCCHPFVVFGTSRMMREECYMFIRRISVRIGTGHEPVSSSMSAEHSSNKLKVNGTE